jgi:hypothetical protein
MAKYLFNTNTGCVLPWTELLAQHDSCREATQEEVDAYFAEQAVGIIKNAPKAGKGSADGETVAIASTAPQAIHPETGEPAVVPALVETHPAVAEAKAQAAMTDEERALLGRRGESGHRGKGRKGKKAA